MEKRLASFPVDWEEKYPHSPAHMAAAGWTYIGPRDRVQCLDCNGKVYMWEKKDCPVGEHMRFNPQCKFVKAYIWKEEGENAGSASIQHNQKGSRPHAEGDPFTWCRSVREGIISTHLYPVEDIDLALMRLAKEDRLEPKVSEVVDEVWDIHEERRNGISHMTREHMELVEENKRLRDMKVCKKCKTGECDRLFMPCGHMVTCGECAGKCTHCPRCRKIVVSHMQVYMA